jgi:hypothetical protein
LKLLHFQLKYFLLTLVLFIMEVIIGLYFHDAIIRPYFGDFLVVILMYCFVKSFVNTPVIRTAFYVLLYAYAVEISQYFHFINILGLGRSKIAVLILGTYFSWTDMLMYTLGILLVILIEIRFTKNNGISNGE